MIANGLSDTDNDKWFSAALGMPCRLVSCSYDRHRNINEFPNSIISFTNEAQFLCISKRSFDMINDKLIAEKKVQIELSRFRGNFVFDDNLLIPFEEEGWVNRILVIGYQYFYIIAVKILNFLIHSSVNDAV